jgi:hypothetical protein
MTRRHTLVGHPDLRLNASQATHLTNVIARSKEAILTAAHSPTKTKVQLKEPDRAA